ncbi:MAG TPA: SDR family NAD(P)-dependent oxidoreductase, partial [Solirubrobacterales bacterium]|nr:SDR family NAD(P)-dependent oxidoreductase [Solirubrobacterales bacterium]
DRAQLEALLDSIPSEHPLGAVYHCAGLVDDGLIEALEPQRLATVLAPKADAAWHLHELTAGLGLSDFVLYSSAAGTLGNPGQGNYAAANAFLDALAQRRRAEGLAATAVAWGLWEEESEITADLDAATRSRLSRAGLSPIATAAGLRLLDRARALPSGQAVAATIDPAALRRLAAAGVLPPLLSGLAPAGTRRRAATGAAFATRLAAAPEAERAAIALDLVREHAAAVLGHVSARAIDSAASFKDLGFDSLGAVELRNRLAEASGVRLEATLVFDHPNCEAAARHLLARLDGSRGEVVVRAASSGQGPIAIVGIACRYPGGAESPQAFWELLAAGGDAIAPFPDDRGWNAESLREPDPERPGAAFTVEGGFLADVPGFDAAFFGIAPREALAMDPQQRLLLECAWEALEDAGIDPTSLAGSGTGVFTGAMSSDYASLTDSSLQGYLGTGLSPSVISGRIAYTLGLEGPAVSVDTACSSSLVSLHLAAQALRGGECDLALAGGVSAMASTGVFLEFARQGGLAPDGRSKSFAAAADGAGFSEGAGLLVLERLSEAERNGHRPLALIRGSAVNQDGASNGLTAPNGPSQERVIRQALANSGLEPGEVDAVEAHGTGTMLGDPIEAQALLATYGQDRGEGDEPLRLGSLKSNIGHTQAAAGVGGVIKMALALRHEELPRTLHIDEPTPHVDWSAGEIELLAEPREWRRNGRPRRAGVSSFGISGTNAHLLLEEAPAAPLAAAAEAAGAAALPLLLSAKAPEALAEQAARLGSRLREQPELGLRGVAATLAGARAQLDHRAVVVGADRAELIEGLAALAAGKQHPALVSAKAAQRREPAFLFPGQGSQWLGMGRELLAQSEPFAAGMAECEAALAPFVEWSLLETIASEDGAWLQRVDVVQPALFATMVSLAGLWRAFGVEPGAVAGHSQGEIAAAVVAGALSLEDGARVSALRSQALAELAGKGGMAALALPAEDVLGLIAPWGESLGLAAHNGPAATVVSGEAGALEELLGLCEEKEVRARRVNVDYASHSAAVEAIEQRLLADLAPVEPRQAGIPVYSTLTGERIEGAELDAAHWYRSLRQPVLFEQATRALLADGFGLFLEASPHPVLTMAVEETAEAAAPEPVAALGTLRRDEGGLKRFLLSLGSLHAGGGEADFSPLLAGAVKVALPTYPFQRQRFWGDASPSSGDASSLGQATAAHPLLGASIALASEDSHLFTSRLSLQSHPWLGDHAVAGAILVPGAALVELALEAGRQAGAEALEELTIEAPMLLGEDGALQLQLHVSEPGEDGRRSFALHSRREDRSGAELPFERNASGALADAAVAAGPEPLGEWPPAGAEPLALAGFYERIAAIGFEYGPAFQGLEAAWRRGEDLYAEAALAPEQEGEAERFGIHPALLDAALHPALLQAEGGLRVPFSFTGVRLWQEGARSLRLRLTPGEGSLALAAADGDGAPVLSIESLLARPLDPAQLGAAASGPDSLLAVAWSEVGLAAAAQAAGEEVETVQLIPAPHLDPPAAARALATATLTRLQAEIADGSEARLAFLTEGAVAISAEEAPDPAQAAVWGLVRSAQSEHPGRFLLIDSDGSEASEAALAAALAQSEEPQLALREGAALAPRLRPAAEGGGDSPAPDPDRTVLLTGGLSGLGALAARHLAAQGAKHLLLASRRGPDAPGAAGLLAELSELGCEATAAACDASDRAQLEELLAAVPAEHPLGAVYHCAGVVDDRLVEGLDPELLAAALAPKADAAWHLHELTAGLGLSDFVLYSSAAGTLGNPGQGNYAAANAFLDALAQRRRAEGLAACSLAWGAWELESEMTSQLSDAQRARIARAGILPLADSEGLALLDRARGSDRAALLPVRLDAAALGIAARAGSLPPLLRGLVRLPPRRRAAGGSLAERLAGVAVEERQALVLELVREHAAAVLGHASPAAVDPDASFKDLGFDSLGAVELRNQLSAASGLRLPSTLVFDYPTAAGLAATLVERAGAGAGPAPVEAAIDSLGELLEQLDTDARELALARLRALTAGPAPSEEDAEAVERIQAASAEEILEIVNNDIGAK